MAANEHSVPGADSRHPIAALNALPEQELSANLPLIMDAFQACRAHTLELAAPLSAEDMMVQSMPDASPTKWHLAHTTWFFETFILQAFEDGFTWFDESFCVLFNSYYNGIGRQHPRPRRGMLSRPSLAQVLEYRARTERRVAQTPRKPFGGDGKTGTTQPAAPGHQPRATAPGTADHGHQARAGAEPGLAGVQRRSDSNDCHQYSGEPRMGGAVRRGSPDGLCRCRVLL